MKLTLTQINRFDKDREGNPLKTKDGRPYTRLVIVTKEYPKSLSGFDSQQTQNWKVGDEVEVEVEQKGEYLNFKVPNKQDFIGKNLEEINSRLTKMNLTLSQILTYLMEGQKDKKPEYPTPESEGIDLSEPPF